MCALNENTLDITVFGPGFGESIILNMPGLGWGLIDSCLSRVKGISQNPALEYLHKKNVQRLAFIVLTHPHEDHYLGLDQIIEQYLGRIDRICYYSGDGIKEYREYLARKEFLDPPSGLRKFAAVLRKIAEAKDRRANIIRIAERTEIIRKMKYGKHEIEMIALSPSAESVKKYVELLFDAIPKEDGDSVKHLSDSHHNLLSSAIWCSIGNLRLVLGSDVERGDDNQTGWDGILNNIDCPDLSSHLVKVSHHGSSKAFHEPAWKIFSRDARPISIITPFTRLADPLPRDSELKKIAIYSNAVAVTARTEFVKPKRIYDRTILKHFRGVKKWQCILEHEESGYVHVSFSVDDGSVINFDTVPPAYLFEN